MGDETATYETTNETVTGPPDKKSKDSGHSWFHRLCASCCAEAGLGWSHVKKTARKMNNETRRLYYTAEFHAMGDLCKDGALCKEEFQRLMMLLGYPGGISESQKLWDHVKPDNSNMTCEEYIHSMFEEKVHEKTDMFRKLFRKFDHNGDGQATIEQVAEGLEELGLKDNETLREKLHSMDKNKDGLIKYEDFLKMQLHQL